MDEGLIFFVNLKLVYDFASWNILLFVGCDHFTLFHDSFYKHILFTIVRSAIWNVILLLYFTKYAWDLNQSSFKNNNDNQI